MGWGVGPTPQSRAENGWCGVGWGLGLGLGWGLGLTDCGSDLGPLFCSYVALIWLYLALISPSALILPLFCPYFALILPLFCPYFALILPLLRPSGPQTPRPRSSEREAPNSPLSHWVRGGLGWGAGHWTPKPAHPFNAIPLKPRALKTPNPDTLER